MNNPVRFLGHERDESLSIPVLLLVLSALALCPQPVRAQPPAGGARRSYTPVQVILDVTSPVTLSVPLEGDRGGFAYGVVVENNAGPTPQKHIGNVRYEPIRLRGPLEHLLPLVTAALGTKPIDGQVTEAGASMGPKTAWQTIFTHATMTRLALPPLDASNRGTCDVEMTLAPERAMLRQGNGIAPEPKKPPTRCQTTNFRVSLAGTPLTVTRVDTISVIRRPPATATGEFRDPRASEPSSWESADVRLTVPETHAKELYDWYEDFVVKGNSSPAKEKVLDIELNGADNRPVVKLHGTGVGIVAFHPTSYQAGSAGIATMDVELYVTQWQIANEGRTASRVP